MRSKAVYYGPGPLLGFLDGVALFLGNPRYVGPVDFNEAIILIGLFVYQHLCQVCLWWFADRLIVELSQREDLWVPAHNAKAIHDRLNRGKLELVADPMNCDDYLRGWIFPL